MADFSENWLILGAVPEKPIYIAAGSGTINSNTVVYTTEMFASSTGSNTLIEDATSFGVAVPSSGFESASVSKASAGMFYEAIATNASGSTQYFQLFNRTTTPPNGAAPIMSFPVAASSTVSISPRGGRFFDTGITWGWSTVYGNFTGSYAGSAFVYIK